MERREPRQVRKEAAVSDLFHVPRGSLAGAVSLVHARRPVTTVGARSLTIMDAVVTSRVGFFG